MKRKTAPEPEVLDPPAEPIATPVEDLAERSAEPAADDDATDADATDGGAAGSSATDADATDDGAAASGSPARRQLTALVAATVVALVADAVSKVLVVVHLADRAPVVVVPKVLDLQLTRNPGAAFGLAGGATILFTLVAVAVVVFIVATARRLRSRGWAIALGLLLGGALGNLGDRLFRDPGPLRGHVVDWIHLAHWPVFNLADSAIVIGGLLAVLLSMRGKRLDGTTEPHADRHRSTPTAAKKDAA